MRDDEREQHRWITTAFCAVAIVGLPESEQGIFLRELLKEQFADAPTHMPPREDTQAYAAFAVRLLLRAIADETPQMRLAAKSTAEFVAIETEGERQ